MSRANPKLWTVEQCILNVQKKNGCWLWLGSTRGQMKYAQFSSHVGTGSRAGHKEVFVYFNGPVPRGLDIGHKCNTPLCINPKHLILQTRKENLQQMVRHGRQVNNLDKAKIKPGSPEFNRRVSEGLRRYWDKTLTRKVHDECK